MIFSQKLNYRYAGVSQESQNTFWETSQHVLKISNIFWNFGVPLGPHIHSFLTRKAHFLSKMAILGVKNHDFFVQLELSVSRSVLGVPQCILGKFTTCFENF